MKRVLVVEDELNLQSIYKKKLEMEGYEVDLAVSAQQGLTLARDGKPDLIILDIMLPGGFTGFDLLGHLKKDNRLKNIPVLVLTNLGSEEETARQAGAADYMIKSDTPLEDVMKKIKEFLKD